jgi:hypothetical protein
LAEQKALAEAKARQEAEERARREALAQARAELEATKLAEEKKEAEALAQFSSPVLSTALAQDRKTRITNVDVVNRSMDRTQMTFGVEFEYRDQMSEPRLGIDVLRQSQPEVARHFSSRPSEIGKSRRNFALFPVKFQPAGGVPDQADFSTDQVLVYLTEQSGRRYNIHAATMLLRWRTAGTPQHTTQATGNSVEIDDFKQNDPSNGYITVKYHLLGGSGKLRARIYDQGNPASSEYFSARLPEVKAGSGVQLIDVSIDSEARTPSNLVRADTIEIELLDASGRILARASKRAAMVWARPQ